MAGRKKRVSFHTGNGARSDGYSIEWEQYDSSADFDSCVKDSSGGEMVELEVTQPAWRLLGCVRMK